MNIEKASKPALLAQNQKIKLPVYVKSSGVIVVVIVVVYFINQILDREEAVFSV